MPADPPDLPGPFDWLAPDWRERDLDIALSAWRRDGFARVPGVVSEAGLSALGERMTALTSGHLDHTPFFFQHDADTGRYEDAPLGLGWVGPSPAYRKVEKLEQDPLVFAFLQNPLFEALARRVIDGPVHLYRTILMTKPSLRDHAQGGTDLPWHQDGGRLWGLSADPELQLWVALDDAPMASGGLSFAARSHRDGLATPLGGKVPDGLVAERLARYPRVDLPARRGDLVLIHNLVWHASGRNSTDTTRRALSLCLIPATTRCLRRRAAPRTFPLLFPPVSGTHT